MSPVSRGRGGVLKLVFTLFSNCSIDTLKDVGLQVPAVYWWYKTASHAAELTAGYHNPTNQDGYSPVFDVLRKHAVTIKFICLGFQLSSQEADESSADPQGFSWQVNTVSYIFDSLVLL